MPARCSAGCGFWIYCFVEAEPAVAAAALNKSQHAIPPSPPLVPEYHSCREFGAEAEHEKVDGYFVSLTIALCLMARAAGVFPLSVVINAWRPKKHQIKLNEQAVIWFSGLRGAIALALAVDFPQFPSTEGTPGQGNFCWQRAHVIACTIVVVLFTVFVMGGLTVPVLKLCGIPMGVDLATYRVQKKEAQKEGWKKKWASRVKALDTHLIRPILIIGQTDATSSTPDPAEDEPLATSPDTRLQSAAELELENEKL